MRVRSVEKALARSPAEFHHPGACERIHSDAPKGRRRRAHGKSGLHRPSECFEKTARDYNQLPGVKSKIKPSEVSYGYPRKTFDLLTNIYAIYHDKNQRNAAIARLSHADEWLEIPQVPTLLGIAAKSAQGRKFLKNESPAQTPKAQ